MNLLNSGNTQGCDGNLAPCSWEDAIVAVAKALDSSPPEQIAAVAGGQADGEVSDHGNEIILHNDGCLD